MLTLKDKTKSCKKCYRELRLSAYKNYTSLITGKLILSDTCKACESKLSRKNDSRKSRLLKLSFRTYKKSLKCNHCGTRENIEFHHRNPLIKEREISTTFAHGNSARRAIEELKKCIPLCTECHWKVHGLRSLKVTSKVSPEELNEYRRFFSLTKASKSYIFKLNNLKRNLYR